eukprot:CAMPEP_0184685086 /NCGR_PEP_ID=MMETSP0312-20130426/17594_1 /TAXON_ID=31354 /ORGANISM="Compsopogon coeruleus, Strain SAG 36.94" /LENGTH=123 /DNA_ID=CAMNT_0027138823 /DNA_START=217 /DNA_END=585 /DNA_ORIENTATION=+
MASSIETSTEVDTGRSVECISVQECHRRKQEGDPIWKHVDVRSPEEYSKGRARDSVNIPYQFKGKVPNPNFLATLQDQFPEGKPLIFSCAHGDPTGRSASAAQEAFEAGFKTIAFVEGGYSAW